MAGIWGKFYIEIQTYANDYIDADVCSFDPPYHLKCIPYDLQIRFISQAPAIETRY